MSEKKDFKFELDVKDKEEQVVTSENISKNTSQNKRRRSPTLLKLQWLAEKVRKSENLRKKIEDGYYNINSQSLAKAIIDKDIGKA